MGWGTIPFSLAISQAVVGVEMIGVDTWSSREEPASLEVTWARSDVSFTLRVGDSNVSAIGVWLAAR